jgi:tellurite methyltransferase
VKSWSRYYEAAGDDARETLLQAANRFTEPGFAVDLGCGNGRDTAELLRRGWRVLAIDGEVEAIDLLRARVGDEPRLDTKVARYHEATWPTADLVNASWSLPFCPPHEFTGLWQRIVASLRPGGRFSGQLFGDRDGWSQGDGMTFLPRDRAEELLAALELERFDEIEEDSRTATGEPKHWHVFHVVARKP